jgi:heme O synthase-like polyprenyltransferase
MDRGRERQMIADDIDAALTLGVFLASVLGGIAAFVLYQNGYVTWAWVFGIASFIGANIGTIGYSRWYKRRARKIAATESAPGSRGGDGAI